MAHGHVEGLLAVHSTAAGLAALLHLVALQVVRTARAAQNAGRFHDVHFVGAGAGSGFLVLEGGRTTDTVVVARLD
jgi:hypothetical protein